MKGLEIISKLNFVASLQNLITTFYQRETNNFRVTHSHMTLPNDCLTT